MSVRRLVPAAIVMAGTACALARLVPAVPGMADVLGHPQRTADTHGADTLVLAAVGLLAWLVWAWGTIGLALTAIAALPGFLGAAARTTLHVVLPAGARRSAALVLGVSLGVAAPFAGTAGPVAAASAAVSAPPGADAPAQDDEVAMDAAPDWPVATGTTTATGAVPDWPSTSATDEHVVVRGDCLWSIAEARLVRNRGRAPTGAEVSDAVAAWWSANDTVIGPDPDLLLPGQVLRAPAPS